MRRVSTFLITWGSFLFLSLFAQPTSTAHIAARQLVVTTQDPKLLLFTATAGFRHDSIPTAIETITGLGNGSLLTANSPSTAGPQQRWTTIHTEDSTLFTNASYLSQFAAVAFVHTTDIDPPDKGTVLSSDGAANLGQYILDGGNFVGIHSAANTLYDYPFYGRLVGAFFDYHAQAQPIVSRFLQHFPSSTGMNQKGDVADSNSIVQSVQALTLDTPATSTFPSPSYTIPLEELYNFRSNPRLLPSNTTRVLLTPAASNALLTSPNPAQGSPHPLAWMREGNLLGEPPASASDGTVTSSDGGGSIPASSSLFGGDAMFRGGGAGRSFYTSLGHDNATWADDAFRVHIAGGIRWALAAGTNRGGGTSASSGGGARSPDTKAASSSAAAGGLMRAPDLKAMLLLPSCLGLWLL